MRLNTGRRRRVTAALLLTALLAPALALDADCQPPNAPPYSGYSLKLGTSCKQYVHCAGGLVTSTLTCPNGLLFNGKVGQGGICDWEAGVSCGAEDPLSLAFDSLTAGGAPVVQEIAQDGGGGGGTTVAATPPPTPPPTAPPTPPPTPPLVNSNPDNYYCGTSHAHAAQICQPCPTGRMEECGSDYTMGCFADVSACGSYGGSASGGTSGSGGTQAATTQATQPANEAPSPSGPMSTPPPTSPPTTAKPTPSPSLPPWTNAPFAPSPTGTGKTVIGYYASWQWYDRNKLAAPSNVDFSKYDRINYAFFQPDEFGSLFGTDEWADPQLLWGPYVWDAASQVMSGPGRNYFCSWDGPNPATDHNCGYHDLSQGILHLAQSQGVEVMPSIGGWTLSDNFPGIAADPVKREHFARQCVDLIVAYGFDGIDLDWEYPGYEDHSGTPADTVNFTLLLQAVRAQLDSLEQATGRSYGLTAALPCGPDKIDKIQVGQIANILTELNLMSYDLHGAWDALTGINAPLVDQGWGDSEKRWSVHGCVNNYVELGVPLSKMNLGLPFYGRSYRDAAGMKQFHGGTDDINWHLDEGSPQYFNVVNELERMTTYRHQKTKTQYAVFDSGSPGMVSYDDPRAICDKVHYANERGMHGFLIWEISGDMVVHPTTNHIVTPLIDATNAKIANPNYDCGALRDPTWALSDLTYHVAPPEPVSVDWTNYVAPAGTGSDTDFDGAQQSRPVLTSTNDYVSPSNAVYVASDSGAGDDGTDTGDSGSGTGDCPPAYTGYFATRDCSHYVYCTDGAVVGAELPCNPGTLFDVTIGVCTWQEQVSCG